MIMIVSVLSILYFSGEIPETSPYFEKIIEKNTVSMISMKDCKSIDLINKEMEDNSEFFRKWLASGLDDGRFIMIYGGNNNNKNGDKNGKNTLHMAGIPVKKNIHKMIMEKIMMICPGFVDKNYACKECRACVSKEDNEQCFDICKRCVNNMDHVGGERRTKGNGCILCRAFT